MKTTCLLETPVGLWEFQSDDDLKVLVNMARFISVSHAPREFLKKAVVAMIDALMDECYAIEDVKPDNETFVAWKGEKISVRDLCRINGINEKGAQVANRQRMGASPSMHATDQQTTVAGGEVERIERMNAQRDSDEVRKMIPSTSELRKALKENQKERRFLTSLLRMAIRLEKEPEAEVPE